MVYAWKKGYPEQRVIDEGARVVKSGTVDEVFAYAEKIKGAKLPYFLTRPTTWRHLIVGIHSLGVMDDMYSPKRVERKNLFAAAPIEAFIRITILYAGRKLPKSWIESAIDVARGSKYEYKVLDVCNARVANGVAWKWLNSDNPSLQLAGLWVCAEKTGLAGKYYVKCETFRIEKPDSSNDFLVNERVRQAMINWQLTFRNTDAV